MARFTHFLPRCIPLSYGALVLGLTGGSTYLLCSAEVLNDAALFLIH
jgi:hypothetical protein